MSKVACVVLPTYNEAENVSALIPKIFEQGRSIPTHELHLVVVDDNSPDGTAKVIHEFMATYPNLHLSSGEKKGLGEAYKRCMAYALKELRADLIFEMDADFQHDPALLPLFVTLTNYGFSVVIGSRFISGGETRNFPWYRRLISVTGTWLVRRLGELPR